VGDIGPLLLFYGKEVFVFMNQELLSSLEYIEKEKGVEKSVLLDALAQALLSACRKTYPESEDIEIKIDPETCDIHLFSDGKEMQDPNFGRIAAQTAKQVIIQKIREAERESIYDVYVKKQGDIITGNVHRIEKKALIVDLGKTEGILPAREQSTQDEYRQGDVIRTFCLEVKKTPRGPEIILSRAHPGLVERLFEIEVPEIHDGIVQIKGAVREPGSRTKIAVYSNDDKIDCVGSCVGIRGSRVIFEDLRADSCKPNALAMLSYPGPGFLLFPELIFQFLYLVLRSGSGRFFCGWLSFFLYPLSMIP